MEMIRVAELFVSVQGEGFWTGTPCYFIRLQGCVNHCSFCDSKDTWDVNGGTLMSFQHIIDLIPYGINYVVITGGEPTLHSNLPNLVDLLYTNGYDVHIETSGNHYPVLKELIHRGQTHWITISPKYHTVPAGIDVLLLADEIKWVITEKSDLDMVDDIRVRVEHTSRGEAPLFYLQPVSCEKEATDLCIQHVIANAGRDYRLSIQVHKYIGVR